MTVESAPAHELSRLAPRQPLRKRLEPQARAHWRAALMLFACACTALATCAITGCGDRPGDARVALTANAARELADTQTTAPGSAHAAFGAPSPGATSASFADSSQSADSGVTLPANTVRSPAKPFAIDTQGNAPANAGANAPGNANALNADAAQTAQDAQTAQNAPLAPPEIHTAE
ncbi:hypothetical protein [Paraburkholderia acidisoli]|uniref:Uncharacterized protein n=1 Tax=Paraburkholderia acidisoli TaxID=2571748 RepID=A0A7Z2JJ02_9BURK|nr:hypothetical protein [Paraburkholderia acidisoli]QGZ64865.1 hypothetical protein FAZ98_23940 [Paraburkholderia acidisoli]